ncbi:polysaccharide biosynthesis tyrosine autokinase [Noviherbaspirillum malthae]|uniref:polysaccharide biosynthesis tyrosine autokinase n=1 Tax=Noviherbaspirillum malthae TaxID=1260987 RepID=UPI00188F87BE|nr:polysaccharide biosynthesis tyrosine autokinase [Noviherbaspirillum malthae]
MNQPLPPPAQSYATSSEQDDDALDLASYLDFLIENRWLIAAIATVVTLLGAAYAFVATPVYQANILIQVEDSAGSSKNILGDLSGMFDLKTAATAEMEILRSRFVVSRAVDNTRLYIDVAPKYFPGIGRWIASRNKSLSEPGLLGMGGYVWGAERAEVSLFNVPESLENQPFELVADGKNGFELTHADSGITLTGQVGKLVTQSTPEGDIELRVDRLDAQEGAAFTLTRDPKLEAIENLQRDLSISEKGKQSGILSVTLEGIDRVKTTHILNELGQEYIRQNVDRKSEEAEKSLAFLEKQLPELKSSLEQAEVKYNAMRNSRGTVDLGEEAKSVLQQSVLTQTRLAELKQKRDELASRFQSGNPLLEAVNQQIRTATSDIEAVNARIKKMPETEQDVFRLTRDVKVNTDLYTSLLNSAQQLRLVKASKVGNARLLDGAAKPLKPVRPKRAIVIGLSLLIGAFLGVVGAFVRKSLSGGIDDPHEIEEMLGLTVSATVPHSKAQEALYTQIQGKAKKVSVLAHDEPGDVAVESLRSFRTSLQFSMLGAKNNIVMVTGPTPGLGKSFVSVNFAAVLAGVGKRVLLIDADLRKGYLHRYFGLERKNGLSEVIAGSLALDKAIYLNVIDKLDFMSTGDLPPRPAELLAHPNFAATLETLVGEYDIVLIDTAPVLAVSDALVVAPHVGSIFSIVRGGISMIGEIEETEKRFRQAGSRVTGIVFNDLKPRASRYGYGSKYGKYRYAQYKY